MTCAAACSGRARNATRTRYRTNCFLLIAGRLHQRTIGSGRGEDIYLDWALREWRWFRASGLIGPAGLVNDGLTADCANNGGTAWNYNQGAIAGGLTVLHEITGDSTYLKAGRSHCHGGTARPDRPAGHPLPSQASGGARATAPTWPNSRASSSGTCTSSTGTFRAPNTATSSSPTQPRYGTRAGTGAIRLGWHGPGRSTGPTRPGRDRRSTRSTPRWVSPVPGQ